MRQKEKDTFLQLLTYKGEFVTSQDLASELSLSDRTIRNYLRDLKTVESNNGFKITAKPGYGYRLDIVDKSEFEQFYRRENLDTKLNSKHELVNEITDRKNFILNKLLLEDAKLNLNDLAEELFISRSSLSKDIAEIKEMIAPYSLTVEQAPGIGVQVEGSERNKRHFIMDNFFGSNYNNSLKEYLGNNEFFQDIRIENLTIIILDEIREAKLKVSDIIIQNLILHLSLAIKRLQEGFEIKDLGISSEISQKVEFDVAENIVSRVESMMHIIFPKEEIYYLALHLIAKSNRDNEEVNLELEQEVTYVLDLLSAELGYCITEDYQLRKGLIDHIKPLLVRLKRNIPMDNPLTNEIQHNYSRAFELTKKYLSKMSVLRKFQVSDDEWAYLTLHLMAAMEKAKDVRKIHALIICATGYGSAQLLKNRVLSEFGKHIAISDVLGYYEINEESLADVDLIISSIDLSSLILQIPILHVSVFLHNEDVKLIHKTIEQLDPVHPKTKQLKNMDVNPQKLRVFREHFNQQFFRVYQDKPSKEQVLEDLASILKVNENKNYQQDLIDQIRHRELMGSIVFSDTIVAPHPALPVGISIKIGVAIIPSGMDWDDQKHINFVFLISPSYVDNEEITISTKAIVKLVDQKETQTAILNNLTFKNFEQEFIELM